MRVLLITILVILSATAFSLVTVSVNDFEVYYTQEALELKPSDTQRAIVRTHQPNNIITMRVLDILLASARPLGISTEPLLDTFQEEQALFFNEWILQEDNEVLLSYAEVRGRRVTEDKEYRRPSYIWILGEYEGEPVYLLFNYLILLNGYAELHLDEYISEDYQNLFTSAYDLSKQHDLGLRGDAALEEPPRKASPTGTWDTMVYITDTGTMYHRLGCQHLRLSRIRITLSAAREAGYTPCSVCNPPR